MSVWHRWVPITAWLPSYERRWLRPDALAALTVWALLVPEAMAYAEMAGVPPEAGLFTAPGAMLGYAIFGSSRQLVVGPSSIAAILSAATVGGVVADGGADFAALTAALALVVGGLYLLMGVARLGFVSTFLSGPVLKGFTFGMALVIIVGQLPKLLGVASVEGTFLRQSIDLLAELHATDPTTLAVGAGSLAVLFGAGHRFGHRVPVALIVVGVSIALSTLLDFEARGVHIVGEIPAGLPSIAIPRVPLDQWLQLVGGAAGIVVVGFGSSMAAARTIAARHDDRIEPDAELLGLGAANVGAGVLGGFTSDASLSRSAANDQAGAKSQMATLLCAVLALATVVAFTPLFHDLPEAVLGAIVIQAVWRLLDVAGIARYWSTDRNDLLGSLGALIGVCAFGLLPGLIVAVAISFVLLVLRTSRPSMPELGRLQELGVYVSKARWRTTSTPGLIVVRFDAPLFFANVGALRARIDDLIATAPEPTRALILDCEVMAYIDTDGADGLARIASDLAGRRIEFFLSRLNHEGRSTLDRCGLLAQLGSDHVLPTVRAAARAAVGIADEPVDRRIEELAIDEDDADIHPKRMKHDGRSEG